MNVKQVESKIFKINGRSRYLPRIAKIEKIGAARWAGVTIGGVQFVIEGGKKAGGSSHDWFLDLDTVDNKPTNGKAIICSSFVDAITCVNGM